MPRRPPPDEPKFQQLEMPSDTPQPLATMAFLFKLLVVLVLALLLLASAVLGIASLFADGIVVHYVPELAHHEYVMKLTGKFYIRGGVCAAFIALAICLGLQITKNAKVIIRPSSRRRETSKRSSEANGAKGKEDF